MKRLILFLVCLILLPVRLSAADIYPMVGAGVLVSRDQPTVLSMFVGEETPLVQNAEKGYMVANRTQIFYDNGYGSEKQGVATYLLMQKGIDTLKDGISRITVSTGSGIWYQVKDGKDVAQALLKLEVEGLIYKTVGISFGGDYRPASVKDSWFLYGTVNLSPRL